MLCQWAVTTWDQGSVFEWGPPGDGSHPKPGRHNSLLSMWECPWIFLGFRPCTRLSPAPSWAHLCLLHSTGPSAPMSITDDFFVGHNSTLNSPSSDPQKCMSFSHVRSISTPSIGLIEWSSLTTGALKCSLPERVVYNMQNAFVS